MIETLQGKVGKIPDLSSWGSRYRRVAKQQQKVARTFDKLAKAELKVQEIYAKLRDLESRYNRALEAQALEVEDAEDPTKLEQEIGALQHDLERAQRNCQAVRRALDQASGEMASLVQIDSEDLHAENRKRKQKVIEKYLKLLDDAVALEFELSDAEHVDEWIDRPETALPAGPDPGRYNALQVARGGVEHALEKATQEQQQEIPA